METKDHLALAKIIVSANGSLGRSCKTSAFEAGCISPDINILTYIKGHTYKGTISYVRNTLSKLHGKFSSVTDYYELGRITHYIADYFTFPHSPNFKGTLKQHVEYESMLHDYIQNNADTDKINELCDNSKILKCSGFIESAHEKYLNVRHSFANDWQFIRDVCMEVTSSMVVRNTTCRRKRRLTKPVCGTL